MASEATNHVATPGRDYPVRLLAIAILVGVLAYLSRGTPIDDALIYARYVRNALAGAGLVYNPGEHVNALTSPLYSYLVLAAAQMAGGKVLAASAVVSGVAFFLACATAEWLVPFAGLLIAGTGYFYSLSGMESSLFLFLLLLPVLLTERGWVQWIPVTSLLLVLTRFEGAALLPPLALELHRRGRWPPVKSYAPAALLALLYLALNHHWYDSFLPASAGAKLGQGRSGFWGRWPFAFFDTAYQLKPEFLPTLYLVIGVVILVIPGVLRLKGAALVRVGLPFLAMLLSFYVLFNIPGYKWYYAPFICFAMVLACGAVPRTTAWRWLAVPVVLLSAWSAASRFHAASSVAGQSREEWYPGIARWLEANAPEQVRVEAGEIGMLGWYCPKCTIVDILGLTSPKNAEHIAHRDTRSWLLEDQPDYIVMHRQAWSFEDVARDDPEYEPVPVNFGPVVYLLRRKR